MKAYAAGTGSNDRETGREGWRLLRRKTECQNAQAAPPIDGIIVDETVSMLKTGILAAIAAVALASAAHALSPTDGHVAGKSYVNSYFHISYTWPAMLKPLTQPPPAPQSNNSSVYAYTLFRAQQGDQPYGVAVVAEKLNVAGPHSTGVKSSAEFVDRIARSLRPGPILSNLSRSQKKNARGVVFEELSYMQDGKPAAVIATQAGEYLIIFKCNAQSAGDFARMENSALAMRTVK